MLPGLCLHLDLEEEGLIAQSREGEGPRRGKGVGMLRPRRLAFSRSEARQREADHGGP